ncbi:hypothetical protein Plhal304r1_c006g0022721 [Plasmopara halstedii]
MKVKGSFFRMKMLTKMTNAARKVWKAVVRYTAKPLLCQGVGSDMAMARNSRREEFKDATKIGSKKQQHIAFDDMCKLVKPDTAPLYPIPASPRCQVVALANWETAPTFVSTIIRPMMF